MSKAIVLEETLFLRNLVVRAFNTQYSKNIKPEDCSIINIEPTYNSTHGYEIETLRDDDYLRMRFYFTLGYVDSVSAFRLEVDDDEFARGKLGDEVYVAIGTVNNSYVQRGIYKFNKHLVKDDAEKLIKFMDNTNMVYVNGETAAFIQE